MLRKESLTEIMREEHGKIYDSFAKFRFELEKDTLNERASKFFNFFKKQETEHIKIENKLFAAKLVPVEITVALLKQHVKIKALTMAVYNDFYDRDFAY